jgi:cytochrome c553
MGMQVRAGHSGRAAALVAVSALLVLHPTPLRADEFDENLARVDAALKKPLRGVAPAAKESCRSRRNAAIRLYRTGQRERAERSLKFCMDILEISETRPAAATVKAEAPPSMAEVAAQAAREVEQALTLTPNMENGLAIYRECAKCHMPEGWGLSGGSTPQIAGQHRKVVIKQLADIRAGNRDNVLMAPYSSVEGIGGAQAVADVAAYIDTLEISVDNGKGPGDELELGEELYRKHCVRCHGETGEGDNDRFIPRIQAQHYLYLVRQFEWIRDGKRRNANPEMVEQIQGFDDPATHALLDYVSRLEPPADLRSPPGWHNPDFAK